MKKKLCIYSILIVLLDQIIKIIISSKLVEEITIIPNFFYLSKAHNYGAAFSILNNQRILLILLAVVIFIFLLKYYKGFKKNIRNNIAFILMYGGLFGNLIDRVVHGYVIDYLKFTFGDYTYPIFNLADTSLCIGVTLLIYAVYKKEDEYENRSN